MSDRRDFRHDERSIGREIGIAKRVYPTHGEAIVRIVRLERELEAAAEVIQRNIPVGQAKGIGILEVAAGCREMARMIGELKKEAKVE